MLFCKLLAEPVKIANSAIISSIQGGKENIPSIRTKRDNYDYGKWIYFDRKNSINGHFVQSGDYYVMRVWHNGELTPGKFNFKKSHAYIPYGFKEIFITSGVEVSLI